MAVSITNQTILRPKKKKKTKQQSFSDQILSIPRAFFCHMAHSQPLKKPWSPSFHFYSVLSSIYVLTVERPKTQNHRTATSPWHPFLQPLAHPHNKQKSDSALSELYCTLAVNTAKLRETVPIKALPPFSAQLTLQRFVFTLPSLRPWHTWVPIIPFLWYNHYKMLCKSFFLFNMNAIWRAYYSLRNAENSNSCLAVRAMLS